MNSNILLTGGLGYIGAHTAYELISAGHNLVIVDNLCNSSKKVLARLESLVGKKIDFIKADVRNGTALDRIFKDRDIQSVIHFAGLKSVSESISEPLRYFDNNVVSTIELIKAMSRANVRRLVFSSSATVYGDLAKVPVSESSRLNVTNPYGRTKLICEDILRDLIASDSSWHLKFDTKSSF